MTHSSNSPPSLPDLNRSARIAAVFSSGFLLLAALTGTFAGAGPTAALLHGIAVMLALPITLVSHILTWTACSESKRDSS